MDKIHIRDLTLRCIIGIYAHERREKQDIIINLTLEGDLSASGRSDHISDTINYKTIKKAVIRIVEKSRYCLIEALAEAIARQCLRELRVEQVTVSIDKPGALRFARSVAVEVVRTRRDLTGRAPPRSKSGPRN